MPFVITKAITAAAVAASSVSPMPPPVQQIQQSMPVYQQVCQYVTVSRPGFLFDSIAQELYCYNVLVSRM